jgi:pantetheine-phosphate adenylyltransferase
MFPGSFDPPTLGHINLIERARTFCDELHIVIADNTQKSLLFAPDERFAMLQKLAFQWNNVIVSIYNGLVAEYAKENDIHLLIRGIRNITDFTYESDLSIMNKILYPKLETIFFHAEPRFFALKSSAIKILASFGGDVSQMVPAITAEALKEKYKDRV